MRFKLALSCSGKSTLITCINLTDRFGLVTIFCFKLVMGLQMTFEILLECCIIITLRTEIKFHWFFICKRIFVLRVLVTSDVWFEIWLVLALITWIITFNRCCLNLFMFILLVSREVFFTICGVLANTTNIVTVALDTCLSTSYSHRTHPSHRLYVAIWWLLSSSSPRPASTSRPTKSWPIPALASSDFAFANWYRSLAFVDTRDSRDWWTPWEPIDCFHKPQV